MRSSRQIIHRPYIPGGLILRDLNTVLKRQHFSKPAVIKKPRQFYIDFIRAYLDPKNTSLKLWQTKSSPKKRDQQWRPAPLRGRAMRFAGIRGEKRKRESCDGGFHRRKNRLLNGGETRAVTEEEMGRDDVECEETPEIVYPEGGLLARELAGWSDTVEEVPLQDLPGLEEKFGDEEFPLEDLPGSEENFEDEEFPLEDLPGSEENFEDEDVLLEDLPDSKKDLEEGDVSLENLPGADEDFGDTSSELSCTMDTLSIIDDGDTAMRTPYTSSEADGDDDAIKQTACIISTTDEDTIMRSPCAV
ncbi:hypothetical protein V8C35DRAFT_283780 [Trichoderma chlorosporum]